jgi:hypothetical protein
MTEEQPRRNGRFPPGYCPPPDVRRKAGTQNRITRDLKHGIIEAAVKLGEDGKGKGGLIGYLRFLGRRHPKAFAQLFGKLIPFQVSGNLAVGIRDIKIVSVPEGHFLSPEQIRALDPERYPAEQEPLVVEVEVAEQPALTAAEVEEPSEPPAAEEASFAQRPAARPEMARVCVAALGAQLTPRQSARRSPGRQ